MTDQAAPERAPAPRAVGIGELLWDLLPAGPRLGGAPFNVVAHLRRLGFAVAYLSAVGDDELGRRALAELARLGVDAGGVGVVDRPTGTVRVQIDDAGVPEYEIVSPAAYEALTPACVPDAASAIDALVFGTLAQRFPGVRDVTREVARAHPAALRVYDVNLRPGCWDPALIDELIGLATVLKLNEAEAAIIARELSVPADSLEGFAIAIGGRYGLRGVCVTRGADGAALLLDGRYAESDAVRVTVVDTVGAGDAFCAGLAAGIVAGQPVEEILERSSRLAGLVASRSGAIPDWVPADLEGDALVS